MAEKKIQITWDDLTTRKVENRLSEQQAQARNRAYAAADDLSIGVRSRAKSGGLRYNTLVYMGAFGLLGGIVAWGLGALLQFKTSARDDAVVLVREMHDLVTQRDTGKFGAQQVAFAARQIQADGQGNEYFAIMTDESLSDADKNARLERLAARDRAKEFIANVLAYGACGLVLALSLAVAEPVVQRNTTGMIVNGSTGAMLGLIGGVAAAFFVDRLHQVAGSFAAGAGDAAREGIAQAVTWGTLGLFLTAGAGVVLRNRKKLLIGLAGGFIGGAIGGALFHPVSTLTDNPQDARLVALAAIGVMAGVATGLIENVAKNGWLRVIAGVLAGKQFILYRNPTFIGSSPDCQIYLFKDPNVGGRHAAIHIIPGGFEIEDLPMGSKTTINGKPIQKTRLRHGDRIDCGATSFLFQEKTKGKK